MTIDGKSFFLITICLKKMINSKLQWESRVNKSINKSINKSLEFCNVTWTYSTYKKGKKKEKIKSIIKYVNV